MVRSVRKVWEGGRPGDVPQRWPAGWRAAEATSERGFRMKAPKLGRERKDRDSMADGRLGCFGIRSDAFTYPS